MTIKHIRNNNRITISLATLATALLLATGLLFATGSASASKQALARIEIQNIFIAPGYIYTPRTGTGYVTVDTTAGTPTPSIMWSSNVMTGYVNTTFTGIYTPFIYSVSTFTLKAGTIQKSWSQAAPTGGSLLVPPTATTKCFASIAPVAPGPPALPGECFPRGGSGSRSPGPNKYGGTARMLRHNTAVGTILNFTLGSLDQLSVLRSSTPQGTGPSYPGNYGIRGTGFRTGSVVGTQRQSMSFDTLNPWTTGQATAMGGTFFTQLTYTGSNNLNTINLTGMISMVQPFLRNSFERDSSGTFLGSTTGLGVVKTMRITFAGEAPEPGTLAMLTFGTLGLAGLARMRRR